MNSHTPTHLAHIELLKSVLNYDLQESTRRAFESMLRDLQTKTRILLTVDQYDWVKSELDKWEPPVTRLTGGPVPRGREVRTPVVLMRRPLKPPGRS
jgi:hypothetical protein